MIPTLSTFIHCRLNVIGAMIARATGASPTTGFLEASNLAIAALHGFASPVDVYNVLYRLQSGGNTALTGDAIRIAATLNGSTPAVKLAARLTNAGLL